MTQDDFKFLTGMTTSYTDEQWNQILQSASIRLASFLCLDELPTPLPADLEELLANFIAGVITHQGGGAEIESKHVRNFTVNFRRSTAANAFAQIAQQYGDTIERWTECDLGINVSDKPRRCCP